MGLPNWDGNVTKTILMIAGIMCLGFIPIYIIRGLCHHAWKRCRPFAEKRKWLKPLEPEDANIYQQPPAPVAPKPLQLAIPAVFRRIERAYKAPAHITAINHPVGCRSYNQDPEAGLDLIRGHHLPSNRSSGGSWDTVRSHHAVSLAHPVSPAHPNTSATNSARSSWMSGGSTVRGVNTTTTPPNEVANHDNSGPSQSHDKRESIGSLSTLRGLVIPEHLIKERASLDDSGSDTTPCAMPAHVKTNITDGNYDHTVRRNAMNHGKGTGISVWLEAVGSDGSVGESSSGTSTPPPPEESMPTIKGMFPVSSVPSQAVSTSSFTPSSTP